MESGDGESYLMFLNIVGFCIEWRGTSCTAISAVLADDESDDSMGRDSFFLMLTLLQVRNYSLVFRSQQR